MSPSSAQPLIYATYQSYLRRGTLHLAAHLADARREGYVLGVKLVKGAYHSLEYDVYRFGRKGEKVMDRSGRGGARGASLSHAQGAGGNEPPVWTEKEDTDRTYHEVNESIDSRQSDEYSLMSSSKILEAVRQRLA